jgi:hypothetical protein
MARNAPLLALAALPVAGCAAGHGEQGSRLLQTLRHTACLVLAVITIWLAALVVNGAYARVFPSPIGPTPFGFDNEVYYERIADFQETFKLRGPIFNDYNIGSLLEYQLYPEPVYVDNRPEAFPASFWRTEYLPALQLTQRWQDVVKSRNINTVIVSLSGVKEAFCLELMRRPRWRLVYVDDMVGIWVRNDPGHRAIISAAGFNERRVEHYEQSIAERIAKIDEWPWWRRLVEIDRTIYYLYSLICIGEVERVWPYLEILYNRYPHYQILHELMRVSVPPEKIPVVEKIMAKNAARPVSAKQVLDWGHYLLNRGQFSEAEAVFQRGRRFFPLSRTLSEAVLQARDARWIHERRSPPKP